MRAKLNSNIKADAVSAARVLFVEKGVDATSMDDVAAALGVSKPLIYQHFPGKQSLLEAVFASAVRDVRMDWIIKAAEIDIPFDVFLAETGHRMR